MNNTELTLDRLIAVSGAFSHYTNVDKLVSGTICSFNKINPQWDVIFDVGTSIKSYLRTCDLL